MVNRRRRIVIFFISVIFVPSFWFVLSKLGVLKKLENAAMELRFFIRGDISAPGLKLIYVNLDEKSLQKLGQEPTPLAAIAETINALYAYGKTKVIASDIRFENKTYPSLLDEKKVLEDKKSCLYHLKDVKGLVLAAWYDDFACVGKEDYAQYSFPLIYKSHTNHKNVEPPIYPDKNLIGENFESFGLINTDPFINDGLNVRWMPLFAKHSAGNSFTLAIEVYRKYFGLPRGSIMIYNDNAKNGKAKILLMKDHSSLLLGIPLFKKQLLELNWFSSWYKKSTRQVSLIDVLKSKRLLYADNFEDKRYAKEFFDKFKDSIVLIGKTTKHLDELVMTPVDNGLVPSIFLHGNLLKTIFTGNFITRLPAYLNFLIIFTLNLFVVFMVIYGDRFGKISKLFIYCTIVYFLLSFGLFGIFSSNTHLVCPIVAPLCSIFTIVFFGVIYQLAIEKRQKKHLKAIFGNYLSPQLVTSMSEKGQGPQLGGAEKNITAFFSDIQNFSTFSELMKPSDLVSLMNEYLTHMTEDLSLEGGHLDKFIGDAIVAMFGAPLKMTAHPYKACVAACKMQKKQAWLRAKWKKESSKWPKEVLKMRTRIGINTGDAIVGNMGSDTRFNYTMMGDSVNLAARCEALAKNYGAYSVASEDTYNKTVDVNDAVFFRYLDRIIVKGRSKPSAIYEIVGLRENIQDSTFECIDNFEKGIQLYLAQDWTGAIEFFERSMKIEPLRPGKDVGVVLNPSMLYVDRCRYMKENSPDKNWNGIFKMKTK